MAGNIRGVSVHMAARITGRAVGIVLKGIEGDRELFAHMPTP